MSREKDSKIVYELVTSKYKIADRNRLAKFRFLNEMKNGSVKRRDSEPSTANTEKTEVERVDISVPGTPVSSRYIRTLRKLSRKPQFGSDSETDNEDEVDRAASSNPSDYHAELQAGLKNFTAEMEKLHDDDASHDPLRKYFEESDKKKSYRRDFSEVVAEFPARKAEPETVKKVEQYFQESDRLQSFKRDFTEVVQTFDPAGPTGSDPFDDLKKVGTPISSRLIAVEKLSSAIENGSVSDIKISNGNGASDKGEAQVHLNSNRIRNKTDDFIKHESGACPTTFNGNSLKIIAESEAEIRPDGGSLKLPAKMPGKPQEDEAYDEIKSVAALKVDDYFKQSQERNTFRRNFSEVLNEIGNHEPAKNPDIEKYFEQSDAQKSFQRPFSQVIQSMPPKIEEILKVGVVDEKSVVTPQVEKVPPTEAPPSLPKVEEIKPETVPQAEEEKELPIEEPSSVASVAPPKPARAAVTQVEDNTENEPPKRLHRSDSTASNISVPGTPVSSRELPSLRSRNYIDTDDSDSEDEKEETDTKEGEQIKALAREFVSEIETLVQKSFEDDDRQEIVLDELKKITSENAVAAVEEEKPVDSDEKLIIQEEQRDGFNPASRVEDYFERAGKENKYARTFSEVESFNEVPPKVKEKVESYFRESEAKKSFKRPFSEAVNYVGPKIDVETLLKPGTPVSSADVMCLKSQTKSPEEDFELDPDERKAQEVFKKAHDVLHYAGNSEGFAVDAYFKQSEERNTYRRNFSEALDELGQQRPSHNPDIEKYLRESDEQKSFQRPFSQVLQSLPPRIDEILKSEEKPDFKDKPYQRSSRASSVSSTGSVDSESGLPKKSRKHGKKYGIDKYFAASLYRTAYHRSNSRRQSRDNEHDNESDLKIVEDEDVFGESDILRKQNFQYDDETRVTQDSNETNENQTVTFWRDFLKPYNLNLQTEITITKDELMNNNRTLE